MSEVLPKRTPAVDKRRRFTRYPVDIRVSLEVFRSGSRFSLWGRTNELGEDGIGATLTRQLEPGEVVALELIFPMAAAPIKIRAVVRYRDGLRHGFEFLTRTPDQRDAIRKVCDELAYTE